MGLPSAAPSSNPTAAASARRQTRALAQPFPSICRQQPSRTRDEFRLPSQLNRAALRIQALVSVLTAQPQASDRQLAEVHAREVTGVCDVANGLTLAQ